MFRKLLDEKHGSFIDLSPELPTIQQLRRVLQSAMECQTIPTALGKGPMQRVRKAGEQFRQVDEDQNAAITSEDEFERWLLAALEWERQRLQKGDVPRSLAESGR